MRRGVRNAAVAAVFLLASGASLAGVPDIGAPVTDLAGALAPSDADAIGQRIVAHRDATSVQIAVLLVQSTGGMDIGDYAQTVFEHWKGGEKGRDNGLLVILAMADRRSRIHVGYGLESQVTDVAAKRILSAAVAPMRAHDVAGAVSLIVGDLVELTGGSRRAPSASSSSAAVRAQADAARLEQSQHSDAAEVVAWIVAILLIILVLWVLVKIMSGGGGGGGSSSSSFFFFGGSGGGSGSSGGSSGGWSGGDSGGGGWSGGGGDSGGGGASGGW